MTTVSETHDGAARAQHMLDTLARHDSTSLPDSDAALRVLRASRFVLEWFERAAEGDRCALLQELQQPLSADALHAALDALTAANESDDAAYVRGLRRLRNRTQVHIAWRAITADDTLDATLEAETMLADACIGSALARAEYVAADRFGKPRGDDGKPVDVIVLGMGKLGGRELNFSSDVDLILLYSAPGTCDGGKEAANEQFYGMVVQRLTRYLSEVTADGFVFRVDWALRPFGKSGPPAMHFFAAEDYYQTHGREWERYAMIKARVVAGNAAAGARFLDSLRPFVYRRYLDYTAIESLRELKAIIAEDVARREQQDNIKLGRGGIRDLEFIVQAFQLIRGGQEEALRTTSLRAALRALVAGYHLSAERAQTLAESYEFLRRAENALQMRTDAQVHELPDAQKDRDVIALSLGLSWQELDETLRRVRTEVGDEFDALFASSRVERVTAGPQGAVQSLWHAGSADDAVAALQQSFGEEAGSAIAVAVERMRASNLVRDMREVSQARLGDLLAQLVAEATELDAPGKAVTRALEVIERLTGRGTYVSLLRESPTARAQLLKLCMSSPWITHLLAQQPMLLDQLLDARSLYDPPGREGIASELQRRLAEISEDDQEARMNLLRRYRQEIMLRVAAADRIADLPLPRVSDCLTWLAECIVEATIIEVRREMKSDYGTPLCSDGTPASFAVIGYGKLGGIEMGYGSDLDVVFLHDGDAQDTQTQGGERSIDSAVWVSRFAQRLVHWLSTRTAAGRVYEVDLQLRPSGSSGLLATTLDAFANYQREHAWTWEHQALVRARYICGSEDIGTRFAELRQELLCRERDSGELAGEIVEMRAKMRAHLDKTTAQVWDIKQGKGGLTDLEFVTQYLVLAHSAAHPLLAEWSDQWRQTEALAKAGIISSDTAEAAIEAYRELRAMLHVTALDEAPGTAALDAAAMARETVTGVWQDYVQSVADAAGKVAD